MEEKKLPLEGYWDDVFAMRDALRTETDTNGVLKFPLLSTGKVWADITFIIIRKTPPGEFPNLPRAYCYALNYFDGNEKFREEHIKICGDNWWHCE